MKKKKNFLMWRTKRISKGDKKEKAFLLQLRPKTRKERPGMIKLKS